MVVDMHTQRHFIFHYVTGDIFAGTLVIVSASVRQAQAKMTVVKVYAPGVSQCFKIPYRLSNSWSI